MSDTGKASSGIIVAPPDFRKKKMTPMTSMIDSARVDCTSLTELRIDCERSNSTLTSTVPGSAA